MTYRIGKTFSFSAAHHLPSLPADHKCSRPHGHTYSVEFVVAADTLVFPGFVTDFGALQPVADYVAQALDHRNLNEVLDLEPTCENVARHLAEWFSGHVEPTIPGWLEAVRVAETSSSWGEYRVARP